MTTKDKQSNKPMQSDPAPDPRHTEAQLYTRMEAAKAKIYGLINQIVKDSGLPTAIIIELLRGVIAETTLAFERAAHGQTLAELAGLREAAKGEGVEKGAVKGSGGKS